MIDAVTTNENLAINTGEVTSSPPPSSSDVSTGGAKVQSTGSGATQVQSSGDAAEVNLTRDVRESLENTDLKNDSGEDLEKELKESIERLNEKLNRLDREIQLKVDQKIGKNYVSVIDKQSQEVIREFPPKEIRNFIARFTEYNEKLASVTDLRSLIVNLEV